MPFEVTELGILANICRNVLENGRAHPNAQDSVWRLFPANCCEYSAWILGAYLKTQGAWPRVRVGQIKGRTTSPHCWLEIDDIFVDVTADQFDISDIPVIVEKKSQRPKISWHQRYFFIDKKDVRPIELYWQTQKLEYHTEAFFLFMRKAYKDICRQMQIWKILNKNSAALHSHIWDKPPNATINN